VHVLVLVRVQVRPDAALHQCGLQPHTRASSHPRQHSVCRTGSRLTHTCCVCVCVTAHDAHTCRACVCLFVAQAHGSHTPAARVCVCVCVCVCVRHSSRRIHLPRVCVSVCRTGSRLAHTCCACVCVCLLHRLTARTHLLRVCVQVRPHAALHQRDLEGHVCHHPPH